jgi:hypothetical protein
MKGIQAALFSARRFKQMKSNWNEETKLSPKNIR